jgi:hypothetical protein
MIWATLAVLAVAGAAAAQTPEAAVSPVKLALARQIIEASGGARQAESRLDAMFSNVAKTLPSNSPEAAKITQEIQADARAELVEMVPALLEISAQATASVLSEQELRDYLAWEQSPSGQSITRQTPLIIQERLTRERPMLTAMVSRLLKKVTDRACEETHCTAEQRGQLAAAMAKTLHPASP